MFYLVKTPWLVEKVLFPGYMWSMPDTEKAVYLSFDDGPHPEATPFVLEELRKCDAKASFFCIGKNVAAHPAIYNTIVQEGHAVGNHSYHHLNGWKTGNDAYVEDVRMAAGSIRSSLYRPPYGKIRGLQAERIKELGMQVVMWSALSGDFDRSLSPDACLSNVLEAARAGSIVVFHDSEKAFSRMKYALPRVLDHFGGKGFMFKAIVLPVQ